MSVIAFFYTTGLIITAYVLLMECSGAIHLHEYIVVPGIFSCAQIIITVLMLGVIGELYLSHLIVVNSIISVGIIWLCHRQGVALIPSFKKLTHKFQSVRSAVRKNVSWEHAILLLLTFFTVFWVSLATFFLPPRGIDDLTYHLPPVFEYIVKHKITLLPLDLRSHFAFPQNAELLFLWPTIFLHSQQFVDGVNLFFALFSVAVVFGLARKIGRTFSESLFIALLFFFTPVVLMQAGSNYIDLIVASFFLATLHCCVSFLQSGRLLFLYSAAVSSGVMCGMKYTMPFIALPLFLYILPKLRTKPKRHLVYSVLLMLLFSGWWYLRNTLQLGNPFYPMNFRQQGMGVMLGEGGFSLVSALFNAKKWAWLYLYDVGLGSYDGGFGLVFWGFGLISWVIVVTKCLISGYGEHWKTLFVWMQLPLGIAMILLVPENEFMFDVRFSIFAVAIGLLAFAEVLSQISHRHYEVLLKFFCIIFAMHSVVLMMDSKRPTYRLDGPLYDLRHGITSSEFRYYKDSLSAWGKWRYAWEPLDVLTRDSKHGVSCYVASKSSTFWIAPLYGTNLQNRIWNLDSSPSGYPDAFVYNIGNDGEISYLRKQIDIKEVSSDPNYLLVSHSTDPGVYLFMKKELFNSISTQGIACKYYINTWPVEVEISRKLSEYFADNIPIITSSNLGYGLMVQKYEGKLRNEVILVPRGLEDEVASVRKIHECYSVESALDGYISSKLSPLGINIFRNTRKTMSAGG